MAGEINFGALQTPDFFGNALRAQQLGQQAAVQTQRRNALSGYATDPQGAITQLASIDPEAASNLSRISSAQASAQARTKASQQYASGDKAGAQATAAFSGDDQLATAIGKMDEQGRAQAKERAASLANVANGLRNLPYEQRKAQLAQLAPQAQNLGLTPEVVQGFDPTDGNIDAIVTQAVGLKETIERHDKLAKPVEMDPTKNYYLPDGGSAPAQAPQGGAPNADAVWAAMKQRESGGNGDAVSPKGAIGSTQMLPATAEAMARKVGVAWRPDLMRGNTPNALAYQDKLGRAYFDEGVAKYGGDLAKGASYYHGGPDESIWGPKTQAYAAAVTQGAPLQGGSAGDTLASGAPGIPGYHQIQAAQAKDGAAGTADPNIVKGLIEGRITPPTQKAAASPYWQAQLTAAAEQDPSFDMVNFGARSKTRADFTSGKSATNITALNTVIGHLDHLDRTIDGLGNTGPGGALNFGPLNNLNNKAARLIANQSGGDVRYKDFETAKTAVANELTRVFRGTGGAEADIQGWMKQLESAGSPEALHGVVRSMAELINSRVEALGEQYSQGMGTTRDPLTLLTPDKQKSFSRLMGNAAPEQDGQGHQGAGQGGALPPQAASQLKAGHVTTFANGQSWTIRNGQPARVK